MRSLSNEISSRRRRSGEPATPLWAISSNATSMGSPRSAPLPSRPEFFTSWQRLAHMKKSRWRCASSALPSMAAIEWHSSPSSSSRTRMRFSVSVPVLSVQITGAEPERLHGSQVTDEDVALCHALGGEHEREGHGRKQAFRHHGDDDAYRKDEGLPERNLD